MTAGESVRKHIETGQVGGLEGVALQKRTRIW